MTMASYVKVVWTFVVMFMLPQCLFTTDVPNSLPTVELKNSTGSSSDSTSKLLPEKNVTLLYNNATEHSENVSSDAKFSGAVPRKMDSGALLRGFYVIVGIGALIVIYGVVKLIRLRRIRSSTVRKYGVLASQEDLEMAPLDADDEEEDTTLFDASRHNQL